MEARECRPQATKSASATRRKLNGVFAASPREKWKTIADAWSSDAPEGGQYRQQHSCRLDETSGSGTGFPRRGRSRCPHVDEERLKSGYPRMNASRSALMVSASVVGIP
jgi:hypothetical protein